MTRIPVFQWKTVPDDGDHPLSVRKSRALVNRGMPVSVLKEDNIFERIISIKYDVPNKELEKFDQYKKILMNSMKTY